METQPATPSRFVLLKAQKDSQKTRWQDHFKLQLLGAGFYVKQPGCGYHGEEQFAVFPEFKFHPERRWQMDFAIPYLKMSIEIEGGIWMKGGGAHSRPMNIQRDVEKQNAAVLLGWHPLRFSDKEIRAGLSIDLTLKLHHRLLSSKIT